MLTERIYNSAILINTINNNNSIISYNSYVFTMNQFNLTTIFKLTPNIIPNAP